LSYKDHGSVGGCVHYCVQRLRLQHAASALGTTFVKPACRVGTCAVPGAHTALRLWVRWAPRCGVAAVLRPTPGTDPAARAVVPRPLSGTRPAALQQYAHTPAWHAGRSKHVCVRAGMASAHQVNVARSRKWMSLRRLRSALRPPNTTSRLLSSSNRAQWLYLGARSSGGKGCEALQSMESQPPWRFPTLPAPKAGGPVKTSPHARHCSTL